MVFESAVAYGGSLISSAASGFGQYLDNSWNAFAGGVANFADFARVDPWGAALKTVDAASFAFVAAGPVLQDVAAFSRTATAAATDTTTLY